MRIWPFGKFEHRESATDAIVSALISQAGGSSTPPSVEALGAVEAAAGLMVKSVCFGNGRAPDACNAGPHAVRPFSHRSKAGRPWGGRFCAGRGRRSDVDAGKLMEGIRRHASGVLELRRRNATPQGRRSQAYPPRRCCPSRPLRN